MTDTSLGRFPGGLEIPIRLLDLIQPSLPGVAPDRIKVEALDTIRDLCQEWVVWVRWTGNSTYDPAHDTVVVHPPTSRSTDATDYAEVCRVLMGRDELAGNSDLGSWLQPLDRAAVGGEPGPGGWRRGFTSRLPGTIELWPRPWPGSLSLAFLVALRPRDLEVPDWFMAEYGELVRLGVMERVARAPGPRHRPEQAMALRRMYRGGAATARRRALKGMVPVPDRSLRFMRFGR